jgi:hypothetical protein
MDKPPATHHPGDSQLIRICAIKDFAKCAFHGPRHEAEEAGEPGNVQIKAMEMR